MVGTHQGCRCTISYVKRRVAAAVVLAPPKCTGLDMTRCDVKVLHSVRRSQHKSCTPLASEGAPGTLDATTDNRSYKWMIRRD